MMKRNRIIFFGGIAAIAIVLFGCLFLPASHVVELEADNSIVKEAATMARDPGTQRMIVACLAIYLVTFVFLEGDSSNTRASASFATGNKFVFFKRPNFWLAVWLSITLIRYYQRASQSLVVGFLFGIVLAKMISIWARNESGASGRKIKWLLVILATLLFGGTFLHPGLVEVFQYHGERRWSGVWDDPNTYGLLMAVGMMLAGGVLVESLLSWRSTLFTEPSSPRSDRREKLDWRVATDVRLRILKLFWGYVVVTVCASGLFMSYSLGACAAAAVGIIYFVWRVNPMLLGIASGAEVKDQPFQAGSGTGDGIPGGEASKIPESQLMPSERFLGLNQNRMALLVIAASLLVLIFWQCRFTEGRPARRIFSAANANDFSLRNQMSAWEGAIRMIGSQPWLGYGWAESESFYRNYYLPPNLNDWGVIQMNDYLILVTSTGVPALVCFLLYVGMSLRQSRSDTDVDHLQTPAFGFITPIERTTCRAGAIVLLIGFCFDGGLFKLETASVFWILLELGRG